MSKSAEPHLFRFFSLHVSVFHDSSARLTKTVLGLERHRDGPVHSVPWVRSIRQAKLIGEEAHVSLLMQCSGGVICTAFPSCCLPTHTAFSHPDKLPFQGWVCLFGRLAGNCGAPITVEGYSRYYSRRISNDIMSPRLESNSPMDRPLGCEKTCSEQ